MNSCQQKYSNEVTHPNTGDAVLEFVTVKVIEAISDCFIYFFERSSAEFAVARVPISSQISRAGLGNLKFIPIFTKPALSLFCVEHSFHGAFIFSI